MISGGNQTVSCVKVVRFFLTLYTALISLKVMLGILKISVHMHKSNRLIICDFFLPIIYRAHILQYLCSDC